MNSPMLNVAFWNYDRTRLLADETVKIDGVDARFHTAQIVTAHLGLREATFRCHPRVPQPMLPALGDLHQQSQRHPASRRPRGQNNW
jgi:hypothetical protein